MAKSKKYYGKLCGTENERYINSLLNDKFFNELCSFSWLERKMSVDMCTLLRAMLLLDNKYHRYEYISLLSDGIESYAVHINNNYSEQQKEQLYDIIDYLEKAFPSQNECLNKDTIPYIILMADMAMGSEYNSLFDNYLILPDDFHKWFEIFCKEHYKEFCNGGIHKGWDKEVVEKRVEIMRKSLEKYFE